MKPKPLRGFPYEKYREAIERDVRAAQETLRRELSKSTHEQYLAELHADLELIPMPEDLKNRQFSPKSQALAAVIQQECDEIRAAID
jgi:hypothetical protein